MSSYPRWKYFLVLLVLLTSFVYSLPNLYQSSPAIEISLNDSTQVQDIIEKLNQPEDRVIYKDKKVILTFNDSVSQLKAYSKLRSQNPNYNYSLTSFIDLPDWLKYINAYPMYLGLDLKGGVHFLLQVDRENITQNLLREIESDVKNILKNGFGIYHPYKSDVNSIKENILSVYNHKYVYKDLDSTKYSRKHLTKELVKILEEL